MRPMRRMIILAGLAAALAGCSQTSGRQGAAAVSGPLAVEPAMPEPCPRMDPRILGEANSETPAAVLTDGGSPALAAALMASEARKNARLREAVAAYGDCRKRGAPPVRRGPVS